MTITISPVEADDIKALIRLNEAAFSWTYSLLFDGPLKESTIDAIAEKRIKALHEQDEKSGSQGQEHPANKSFDFKAVDDSTGEIVGEAHWMIYYEDEELTKSIEDEVEDRINPPIPQMQVQPTAEFGRILATTKRETLAVPSETGETTADPGAPIKLRKRVYLGVLVVHPNHQKRGIGRQLLQWGLDEADRLGLVTYLEASTDGVRLYESAGFEKLKDVFMNLRPFGAKGDLPIRLMIRQPKPTN
ncbi:uncharacterized protein BHQ10_002363 [Talaromyces amestolkiae]|uniref:N-acetyltransferase domain-containing protein n=1 Tax=Talaromyces amestolkiae TaxID=1196081 RepID=A0A364KS71_TALAM|nr:uncharacterized protein BHQ10_002363 [Talaromyces amestolkiae]RAO66351.1 hypothetical protein BHQ10_002363 [Talaromyces amestolkiae]